MIAVATSAYQLAHRELPEVFFARPRELVELLAGARASEALASVWEDLGGRADPCPEAEALDVADGLRMVIVHIPAALAPGEAPLVALVVPEDGSSAETAGYYTLEHAMDLGDGPTTLLCEWDRNGRHLNHGPGPDPRPGSFADAVLARFRQRPRTIRADGGRLEVSDDPHGCIATLLDYASREESLPAGCFDADGEGYAAPSLVAAVRVTREEDIPPGWDEVIPFEPDVWVVFKDRPDGSGMHVAWLRGPELRALLARARQLRAGDAEGRSGMDSKPRRPQRVRFVFDASEAARELPFVVGVVADLAGTSERVPGRLDDRRFLDVPAGDPESLLETLAPTLDLALPGRGEPRRVAFRRLSDFGAAALAEQLGADAAAALRDPALRQLAASWHDLCALARRMDPELGSVRVLTASKRELSEDFREARELRRATLFREVADAHKVRVAEPFAVLLADHAFDVGVRRDVELLENLSHVAAAGLAPVVAAAAPGCFGFDAYEDLRRHLARPQRSDGGLSPDVARGRHPGKLLRWHALRQAQDSRFLVLTAPRVLARAPEPDAGPERLWGHAVHAVGAALVDCFARDGWGAQVAGGESDGAGLVEWLPGLARSPEPGEPGAAELGAMPPQRVEAFREQGFAVVADAEGMPGTLRIAAAPSVQAVPAAETGEDAVAHARMRELGPAMADTRLAQTLRAVAILAHGRYGSVDEAQDRLGAWLDTQYVAGGAAEREQPGGRLFPLTIAAVQVSRRHDRWIAELHARGHAGLPELPSATRVLLELPDWLFP